jgi:hypothetical protein
MKHLKKFNEDVEVESTKQTLRDLIGDIKETKNVGYHTITETTKGCFTNLKLDEEDLLDSIVEMHKYGDITELYLKPKIGWGWQVYAYFEGDIPKIISTIPGDERGSCVFGDIFISSGHDGNYLWNIKTGEFKPNTW